MDGPELRKRLDFDDAALVAECDVQNYKASGPGGQHRNKVTSAVRLVHRASGLMTVGTESRSQHENKTRVIKRMRELIALSARAPLPADFTWPETVHIQQGRLRVNEKNAAYFHVVGYVLDALTQYEGRLADAAAALGVTSSSLARFAGEHSKVWAELSRIRQQAGLPPLKHK